MLNEKVSIRVRAILKFRTTVNRISMSWLFNHKYRSHIAMFHNISIDGRVSDGDDCRLEDFVDYLNNLLKNGFSFLSVEQLLSSSIKDVLNKKAIVTFDDGWESVYSVAYPELKRNSIPFVCFITTSFIDKEGFLNKKQLAEMASDPLCTIGMHSDQHVFWRTRKRSELEEDFLICREGLIDIIGYEPKYYAFPYGTYLAVSNSNIKTIKNLNVEAIFLTDQRKLMWGDIINPLHGLPRLDIAGYYNGIYGEKNKALNSLLGEIKGE